MNECIGRIVQVVANIHYHEDAALEVHRIDPLLAAGKCVLSEYSCDADLDALYTTKADTVAGLGTAAVMFASYDDFVAEAVRLVASATRRAAMSSTAKSLMWERLSSSYPQQLHDALEALPRRAEVDCSEESWAKWASSATGRAQFSQAISVVQGWAKSYSEIGGDGTSGNCATHQVEAVIAAPGQIGIRLEATSDQVRPQIAAIVPGSQAAQVAGLRVGMMLIAVQGTEVGPGREQALAAIVAAGRPLSLLFQ